MFDDFAMKQYQCSVAVNNELSRLDRVRQRRDYLDSINYHHTFNPYTMLCDNCGIRQMDYYWEEPKRRESQFPDDYSCNKVVSPI